MLRHGGLSDVHLSVNELEALARRAVVGAGLDHGHAAEAGRALVGLTAAGFDGTALLARMLRAWDCGGTAALALSRDGAACRLVPVRNRPACALFAAPALRDFAQLMVRWSVPDRVEAGDVADPAWVIGQFLAESWRPGLGLACLEPVGGAARWTLRTTQAGPVLAGHVEDGSTGELLITTGAGTERPGPETMLAPDPAPLYERGVEIDGAVYDALKSYFNRTLVPDSEASRRHGAGAGLVDTD